ncbi:hypothetical protein Pint_30534 [Pistacia integerrima]|uniref:Uncharacterized protein n=1 Tax=Pistacia integerrima TaxID=434235 RepID=A0ACC0X3T9_9ROSI|nr:hypothetical protein Pint_30534 [Pistacia integerrima]
MGNVFSSLISAICEATFPRCLDCTSKKVAYIRELEDNVNSLKNELQKLVETKADVKTGVDAAEQRPQMRRLSKVQGWLSRAEAEVTEVGELLRDSSQEIEKLCLGGYCSKNLKSSYKFGKKVAKKLQDVVNLKNEGAFEVVAQEVPEPAVDLLPMQPTIVGLQSIFDKVWNCLVGEEVEIIGIYGTGGVGKTTLLKQINNKFCNELQGFDLVIWVVVSKVPNFEKIQEDIGKKIGLNNESWKTRSVQEKAGDIFKILSSKKFVLLLDDLWKWIDLTEVGVPIPNSKPVSKVVFTTRFFEVCGTMNTNKDFKVEYLTDEEAWKLFEKNLKSEVLEHPDIPQFAEVVAKECGGLPLALLTVSRAMSCKKTPQEWRYAANLLRNSASKFADRTEDSVLFDGGGEILVEECDCLEYLNVLSITLGTENALQRLLSSVKLQCCTQSLLLQGFHELTSFNISALATLKHLCELRIDEWQGTDIVNVGDAQKIRELSSFYSLHDIRISDCYSMRDLTWIVFIPNLKTLFVDYCTAIQEIINVEKLGEVPEMISDLIPFQKLQFLRLDNLKNLKSIFGKALPFPHLKGIQILDCPKLKKLPLDANSAKEHKIVIKGQEEWWKELQWEDEATLNAFLPCFKSQMWALKTIGSLPSFTA